MKKLKIIYEDKDIIVINKPSGILTVNDGKQSANLYHETREYIKKQNPRNKIFIVHRLDKDTSGVIIFAKSEQVKYFLQNNWEKTTREYYA
ncbi:MAG: RNA pseudouridine synthase, partial [Bacilli bacterium]|nr:RNA pseudouridine synthase [Bacilli bacterium]